MKADVTHIHINTKMAYDWFKLPNAKDLSASQWLRAVNSFLLEIEPHYTKVEMEKLMHHLEFKGTRAATISELNLAKDIQATQCKKYLQEELSDAEELLHTLRNPTPGILQKYNKTKAKVDEIKSVLSKTPADVVAYCGEDFYSEISSVTDYALI